jgi:RimJ/RimL family protein N-acetyltransferase
MYEFRLETESLLLREFRIQDAEGFFTMNNDPQVLQYTGDDPFISIGAAADFIRRYDHYDKYGYGRWTILQKEDESYLGFCGLKYHPATDEVDLGYRLRRNSWGKGYATEAASACLRYGFQTLQLPCIIGRVAQANTASIRILEKIGMTFVRSFDFAGQTGRLYAAHRENF